MIDVQGGFRVALFTRPAIGPPRLQEWPLPREALFATQAEADAWARWVLLGVSGFGKTGEPLMSAF